MRDYGEKLDKPFDMGNYTQDTEEETRFSITQPPGVWYLDIPNYQPQSESETLNK